MMPTMTVTGDPWYKISNVDDVPSPALLIYPERVVENVDRMISLAGGMHSLRPHVKTHKLGPIVRLQVERGITRFKAATLAEVEMAAQAGALDVLLAYQPVGPNVRLLLEMVRGFPATTFSAVVDDAGAIDALSEAFADDQLKLRVLLDIDCGMHRTGVSPDERADALYSRIARSAGLVPAGLHAYDGHLHDTDVGERTRRCHEAFAPVLELRARLLETGLAVPTVVAGGTPTFPIHAARPGIESSPGTCVLWDAGYASQMPDLDFLPAAAVLTRVVSKPSGTRLCLDLGHKAIASENPPPRVCFPELSDARSVMHSEEHVVIETAGGGKFEVGDVLYGVPWHVCPTVALHSQAVVVEGGRAVERWPITRQRALQGV